MQEVFRENTELVGTGKDKATITEVLYGNKNVTSVETDAFEGVSIKKQWSTGATPDDPYGLLLLSQEVSFLRSNVAHDTNEVYLRGFMLATPDDDEVNSLTLGVLNEDYYQTKDILCINRSLNSEGYNYSPSYIFESYENRVSRVFIAPILYLNFVHFVDGNNSNDKLNIMCKWTFKKVKMSKSAFLEKLAYRSYN
jgi:hypothetical protein